MHRRHSPHSNRDGIFSSYRGLLVGPLVFPGLSYEPAMHREQVEDIAYHIRRTRSAKRMTLRISHSGEVGISIPYHASLRQARQFLRDNLPYVRAKLEAVALRRNSFGDTLREVQCPVRGTWLPVRFEESPCPGLDIRASFIAIRYPQQDTPSRHRAGALRFWREVMIAQAKEELPQRTAELAGRVGETVGRISVRDQKSRWGSCSAKTRSINLNWRCVLFPEDVRDYLIYHEVAHLRHANHSTAYWQLVGRWYPAYREAEHWISLNEQRLMTFTRDILSIGS